MKTKPLSKKQKAAICSMAGRVYKTTDIGRSYSNADELRRGCVIDATGKDSLTKCDQLDYIPIVNYLRCMLGLAPRVDRTPRSAIERILWVVRENCARWELPLAYAEKLANMRLGNAIPQPLESCALQLGYEGMMQINYTINSRGRAKMAQAGMQRGDYSEPHSSRATMPPDGLARHFQAQLIDDKTETEKKTNPHLIEETTT